MIFFVLLILIDQLSKYLVRSTGGFYICNEGIFFGLHINQVVFLVLWLLIIAVFLYTLVNHKKQETRNKQVTTSNIQYTKRFLDLRFGILLILGGAISNIIDRLYFGCVIDFISLGTLSVFNLADAFITIGVIITLVNIENSKNKITNSK